ncbi:transmembrane protein 120A-A isoform X2 [Hippocampus comes]|uniref:transmembrane protein 120A-A isoform X2 n=1 Tax=Hippocampus comes TaxID=109280 RepID=UPI00094E2643|nr:PREDICTED: transmembrane protein 120A-like isoform X2 [Hippocampus comes]
MLFSPTGVSECFREWGDLEKDYQQIQDTHRLYRVKLEEVTKLQNSCTSAISRHRKKLKELLSSLEQCKVNHLEQKLSLEQVDSIADIQVEIGERADAFSEMEAFLPKKNGYRALDALFNFLLVWYYCTLTIRESILINNGSRIRGWWVFHHYVSTFLSGVMLTWPEGTLYQMFRNQFLSYCLYQSFVQFLQYYYQSGCLYRLRALGERHNMDLTVEGFQSWMWRGLTFLLPFLFFGQFWQLYNGVTLFKMFQLPECKEWQVAMCCCSYMTLFLGNFFTTLGVVYNKYMMNQDKPKTL